jgi:formamidopyrimidine-DNA glycosylase
MTYYELKVMRGDRVEITKDILNFEGNRVLAKKGQQGTYEGGSCSQGLILLDGKKRNVKIFYDYLVKVKYTCEYCGKEIETNKLKRHGHCYCSECFVFDNVE